MACSSWQRQRERIWRSRLPPGSIGCRQQGCADGWFGTGRGPDPAGGLEPAYGDQHRQGAHDRAAAGAGGRGRGAGHATGGLSQPAHQLLRQASTAIADWPEPESSDCQLKLGAAELEGLMVQRDDSFARLPERVSHREGGASDLAL